jgi:hypothetical protein
VKGNVGIMMGNVGMMMGNDRKVGIMMGKLR